MKFTIIKLSKVQCDTAEFTWEKSNMCSVGRGFYDLLKCMRRKKSARSSLSSIQTRNIAEHEKCFEIIKKPKARSVQFSLTHFDQTLGDWSRDQKTKTQQKREKKKLWFYNRANWSISPILIALSLRLIPLSEHGEFVVFDFRFSKARDGVVWVAVVQWIFRLLAMLSQRFGKTLK